MRILACDGIHEDGLQSFRAAGWTVDVSEPIKDTKLLRSALKDADVLLVRSATKVPAEALEGADRLKVIGRAGAGVDTIDVDAATERGIAVMNAPDGNTLAAAEHALALLFSLARHIPPADAGMKSGEWPKTGLTGYLPAAVAARMDVPMMPLDELLHWCDIVTLHIPRTAETTNLLDDKALKNMRKGTFLINAARGGLVDETALLKHLDSGHLAGAALDTFVHEPLPADSPLRSHPRLILTPHLGASTSEAQKAVSTILARQILDFFASGAVAGCVNLPPLSPEAAREMGPWMPLMTSLGKLCARLVPAPVKLHLTYAGRVEALDSKPLTRMLVAALLGSASGRVTPVNALQEASLRGLEVSETVGGDGDGFDRLLRVRVENVKGARDIEATLHRGPRVVRLDGVELDFDPRAHFLLMRNEDRPGVIGLVGSHLGAGGINIINFSLGATGGGDAVAAITVDRVVPKKQVDALRAIPGIVDLEMV